MAKKKAGTSGEVEMEMTAGATSGPVETFAAKVMPLEVNFGREDLNMMARKINEIVGQM